MTIPRPSLIPPILFLITCTVLLCLPGSAFPEKGWLKIPHFDKWVHIGLFAVLTVLWCWWRSDKPKAKALFLLLAVLAVVYGIVMEFVQRAWIPNRSFDTGDILADAGGSLAGYLFSLKYLLRKRRPAVV